MELITDVPRVKNIYAYISFGLNIFIPGIGTIAAACIGEWDEGKGGNKTQLVIGFLQLLTSVYLIGWLCSIYWGYLILIKSQGDHEEIKTLIKRG